MSKKDFHSLEKEVLMANGFISFSESTNQNNLLQQQLRHELPSNYNSLSNNSKGSDSPHCISMDLKHYSHGE